MDETQVIILAAGQGLRLRSVTGEFPKALIRFDDEPLLLRTIHQLQKAGFSSIRIVVGYQHEYIKESLKSVRDNIEFVYNEKYAQDTNSLSLYLGLQSVTQAALVIEADVAISDPCWPIILNVCNQKLSTWFTHGLFKKHQIGGIIKSDSKKNIVDMRIVPQYAEQYAAYSKNLGVVYIGPQELNNYKSILSTAVTQSETTYYMQHWITHIAKLNAKEEDLSPYPAGSFNTIEELEYCKELFSHNSTSPEVING